MRVRAFDQLPDKTEERKLALIHASVPDPSKPSLPEEMEQKLREVDRRSAECYADIEDKTFRLHRLANKINNGGDR